MLLSKDLLPFRLEDQPTVPTVNWDDPNRPTVLEVGSNHIYFYSGIVTGRCLALIKSLREMDGRLRSERQARDLSEDHSLTPIWLHIESGGGSIFSSFSVADQIKKLQTPVYSKIEGYAASGATLISMACKKRFILPSAFMMIHQLSSSHWGNYEELKDEMHLSDMCMEGVVKFYKEHSKLNISRIKAILKRNSWFNAQESLKLGLVDAIL